MPDFPYLIVGGGMTAAAAVEGILEHEPAARIGMIGDESHPPYNRPPLSKGLWKGKPLEGIWRKTHVENVTMHLGRRAVTLDLERKLVRDDNGVDFRYGRLLLATGGTPRRLRFASEQAIYFRTLDDYQRLRALADRAERLAVIGGGFIGSEIAAAMRMLGKEVVLIFPDQGIGTRIFPGDLSAFVTDFYRTKGVDVLAGQSLIGLQSQGDRVVLRLRPTAGGEERELTVDGVVAGLGIQPNTDLAQAAGIRTGNGIGVDEFLRTSASDVYAAGDVAEFLNTALQSRFRVEHEDNANTMGKFAGQNMAGARVAYHHQPYFYSDLFELGYEAVGDLDPKLEVVSDWAEPFRQGVVYYQHDQRVRGVLLWNVWDKVDEARRLIADAARLQSSDLKGRIRP